MSDDFELLGAPHATRARDFRARVEHTGPQHPDFTPADEVASGSAASDEAPEADAAVDFVHVGHLVSRIRAAFFSGDS